MSNKSRYLYRYIGFCSAEILTSTLYLIKNWITRYGANIVFTVICFIYLAMATWRIIESTFLNNYFNAFKKSNTALRERNISYIPPNQSLMLANMISGVQTLIISLTLIFDCLE